MKSTDPDGGRRRPVGVRHPLSLLLFLALALPIAGGARAQDLDPRAFAPAPVGLNFALLGYSYSDGGVFVDQSVPAEDATGEIHQATAVYVRTLDLFGVTAKAGGKFAELPASEIAAWKKTMQPITDGWIDRFNKSGKDGSKLYAEANRLLDKHSK